MLFASGVGANGNVSLGAGAVGGMFIGMVAQIFVTPVLFTILQVLQERFNPMAWDLYELEEKAHDYSERKHKQ